MNNVHTHYKFEFGIFYIFDNVCVKKKKMKKSSSLWLTVCIYVIMRN